MRQCTPSNQHGRSGPIFLPFHSFIFQVTLKIHIFSLIACVASTHFSNNGHLQPCHSYKFPVPQEQSNGTQLQQCTIWSEAAIPHLCSVTQYNRLFSVGWKENESKWNLAIGENGKHCISGNSQQCSACYHSLARILRKLDEAYRSFDATLARFDCLPALDTASATRPFSPNATCHNCKLWYRRWLLVQSLPIWNKKACVNWCYYTQLACPHLAPAKLWDYAGHPSFQCRDMDIDSWRQECECVHPCDVTGIVSPGSAELPTSFKHDFFAAQVHCENRKKQCHARSTAHDRHEKNFESDVVQVKSSSSSVTTSSTTTPTKTSSTLTTGPSSHPGGRSGSDSSAVSMLRLPNLSIAVVLSAYVIYL